MGAGQVVTLLCAHDRIGCADREYVVAGSDQGLQEGLYMYMCQQPTWPSATQKTDSRDIPIITVMWC